MKTFTPKPNDLTHDWYIVDATDVVLGRLATQVAQLLRGKQKPTFAPHADAGDFVVIINAEKIAITGNKADKSIYTHSGYPGGLRAYTYGNLIKDDPARMIKTAVRGMLPKNKLAKVQLSRLRVFTGSDYPYAAQKPVAYEIKQVSQQAK